MHLAEGILSGPILLTGAAIAAAGTAVGLRAMRDDDMPRVAMLTTAFFVASLIHVPIGPGSVHLILSGLCGILLGWRAFPAILIALFLQTALFGFGGLTVLGVNLVILAGPASLLGAWARARFVKKDAAAHRAPLIGALIAAASIAGSGLLAAAALGLSNRTFIAPAAMILVAHAPVMVVESIITAGVVAFLARVHPALLFEGA